MHWKWDHVVLIGCLLVVIVIEYFIFFLFFHLFLSFFGSTDYNNAIQNKENWQSTIFCCEFFLFIYINRLLVYVYLSHYYTLYFSARENKENNSNNNEKKTMKFKNALHWRSADMKTKKSHANDVKRMKERQRWTHEWKSEWKSKMKHGKNK